LDGGRGRPLQDDGGVAGIRLPAGEVGTVVLNGAGEHRRRHEAGKPGLDVRVAKRAEVFSHQPEQAPPLLCFDHRLAPPAKRGVLVGLHHERKLACGRNRGNVSASGQARDFPQGPGAGPPSPRALQSRGRAARRSVPAERRRCPGAARVLWWHAPSARCRLSFQARGASPAVTPRPSLPVLLQLLRFVRPHAGRALLGALAAAVTAGTAAGYALVTGPLLEGVMRGEPPRLPFGAWTQALPAGFGLAGVLVLLATVKALAQFLQGGLLGGLAQR